MRRLVEVLAEFPAGSRLLDLGCGQGRHANLLAAAGFAVDGVDYSDELLALARRGASRGNPAYHRHDMRRLPARWSGRFDVVVNLFTSFGFFERADDDATVIGHVARVLKPGGVLVWHGGSRDGVVARFLGRDWWLTSDGTMVGHERSFDPLSGVLQIRTTWRGRTSGEREHRIRLYTATRLAELCQAQGLVVEQAFDGWRDRPLRRRSSEMLLVARKD
ncbi:MAG: methyltransferase domain-containing protein [Gemmatimonadaceae bacterium]|nr:methyltransferase domain-containing protein [Gemmatimonadaceae bacterium]